MGKILSSLFRGSDIVSRVGEDSFLVYSAGAISEEGRRRRRKRSARRCALPGRRPPVWRPRVSVGVYLAQGAQIPFERLFGQAAAAIYEARSNGTGSVCVLTDEKDGTEGPSRPAER